MVSIVIPCYNEADNIKHLFIKANDVNRKLDNPEFIFVNNGSSDNTLTELYSHKFIYHNLNLKILNIQQNLGYGNGILKGILEASHTVIAWTHADLQTDLEDIVIGYNIYIYLKIIIYVLLRVTELTDLFLILFLQKVWNFLFLYLQIYLYMILMLSLKYLVKNFFQKYIMIKYL